VKGIDCAHVERHDLIARYLGGKLSDSDAELFETHLADCDGCWQNVSQAGEIREAFGQPFSNLEAPGRRPGGDLWTPLAAAAVLAALAFGLGRFSRRADVSPSPQVLRDNGADTLNLTIRRTTPGLVSIDWPPNPGASRYRIEVLRSDGLPVQRKETSATSLTLDLTTLPHLPAGISFGVRIQALDAMESVVAESGLIPLR